MEKAEIYKLFLRVEYIFYTLKICADLDECYADGVTLEYMESSYDYMQEIYSYLRVNQDVDLMLDCCRIDRSLVYKIKWNKKSLNDNLLNASIVLLKIHDLALSKIYHIEEDRIDDYFISYKDGKCRNKCTKEIINAENINLNDVEKSNKDSKTNKINSPGAPKEDFRNCIIGTYQRKAEIIIENIRKELINNNPKSVYNVIAALIQLGFIAKPSYSQFNNTFQAEGDRSYISRKSFQGKDLEFFKKLQVSEELKIRLATNMK